MSWTCTGCKTSFEQQDDTNVRFCPVCGASAYADQTHVKDEETLDKKLRAVMLGFGVLWMDLFFFLPISIKDNDSPVWSWDLLTSTEDMAYMMAWSLVVGVLFIVLGVASPLPRWVRHGGGLLLSLLSMGVLSGSIPGSQFSVSQFSLVVCWLLMFFVVGTSLMLLVKHPGLLGVKLFLGLGLVFGAIAYLSPTMDGSSMAGDLLFDQRVVSDVGYIMARVLLLLPMFALLLACVGFASSTENLHKVSRLSKVLGLAFLIYVPALTVLLGLLMSSARDSIWYLLIFVKLAIYVGSLFTIGNISSRLLVRAAVTSGRLDFTSGKTS